MRILIYLLFICTYIALPSGAEDELEAVVVIFRHGDRTPIKPYPNDPYKNASYWPVGFGQLTNRGKVQQFELGKWLRNRYQDFLPSTYSEKDIYVRSTDVDRTLMSAEANLAGLYPPNANQTWDTDIKWQPIPIHTTPEKEDALLAAKKPCPKYKKLQNELFKSPFFQNVTRQNRDLYAYLTRYSGVTVYNLETLEYLYSTFYIETVFNYALPQWAQKVYPQKLKRWAFLSFSTAAYTPELARLKTGPLFNHIITFFDNRTSGASDTPKFLIFSAHDTTIANVLNTMGAFEYHAPPYASTILFELRKRNNGHNYVNIFYKNTTEPRPISLKHCNFSCDFADFVEILKPISITLDQREMECRLKWTNDWSMNFESAIISASILLSMILIITGIIVGLKKTRKEKETSYVQLPSEEYA